MRAMVLNEIGKPLQPVDCDVPQPAAGQLRVKIAACGVCRTDLHLVDGELPDIKTPIIPGHEIVGYIDELGAGVSGFGIGERIGIPWLGHSCGQCFYCCQGNENLCDAPGFTGYTINGGFAEYACADAHYCFPIPEQFDDLQAAPLLCAGLIGHRALKATGDAEKIGIYGFGAAAHVIAQVIKFQKRQLFAFTRPGDTAAQEFARGLGAVWAGASDQPAPELLDAAIIFAPIGTLVPQALKAVRKGGRVICGGIHMSDIPAFPYSDLWGERMIMSIANLTRQDAIEFLSLAAQVPVRSTVHRFDLTDANNALKDLRDGRFTGAAVLVP